MRGIVKGDDESNGVEVKQASVGVGRRFGHHPRIFSLVLRGLPLMLGLDSFSVGDFSLVNPERKSTLGVGARPGLVHHGRTLLPIIR